MTNNSPSRKIRIYLKRSKTDQFDRGVAVWVGESGDDSCPVKAIVDCQTPWIGAWSIFQIGGRNPTNEKWFCGEGTGGNDTSGY